VTDTLLPQRNDRTTTIDVAPLRAAVTGEVLEPGDAGYDEACSAWNTAYRHRPAVVVIAATTSDVVEAVRFAAASGLGLGVQATGHGVARTADGGVLLRTERLDGVLVDPVNRTALVKAGATWAPVLAAAQLHGLAPLLGSSPGVGAVGYTLGGGLGWLARKHGAAADSVRAFEVVTAAGKLVRASADEHQELFWALRGGGGGSLGIVTAMEIELFPVTTVYGGSMLYPAEAAREVVERYVEWVAGAPDELTTAVVLMNFPPLPEVPEPLRGRSFTILRGCWSGPLDEGRALLDAWREAMPPIADLWTDLPFSEVAAISNDPVDPMPARGTGGWLADLDGEVADVLAARTFPVAGPPPVAFSEVRHIGGAVGRGERASASYAGRDHEFLFHALGMAPTPEAADALTAHHAGTKAALGSHLAERVYPNMVDGAERVAAAAASFDEASHARLRAVKAEVDPGDVLRFGLDLR
jgi:hypothetical protein